VVERALALAEAVRTTMLGASIVYGVEVP